MLIPARYPALLIHGSRYNHAMVKILFPILLIVVSGTGCSVRSERPITAADEATPEGVRTDARADGVRGDLLSRRLQEASLGPVQTIGLAPLRGLSQTKRRAARFAAQSGDDDEDEDESATGICPLQTPEGRAILVQSAEGRALLDQQ